MLALAALARPVWCNVPLSHAHRKSPALAHRKSMNSISNTAPQEPKPEQTQAMAKVITGAITNGIADTNAGASADNNADAGGQHSSPAALLQCIHQRRSTRAFLSTPVPQALLEQLLQTARRAPSGGNLQPGQFIAVRGDKRQALTQALLHDCQSGVPEREDYSYFPQPMPMQLRKRQVASAQALYNALGVARDDRAGRAAQFTRNYEFFNAPVALIVTIDARLGAGCYMDLGMALYGLQLAAAAQGLASCAIGALASYPDTVRRVLGLPAEEHIVCGLALGWADDSAPVNQATTTRAPLAEYFRVME